jgi:hypothetical protein
MRSAAICHVIGSSHVETRRRGRVEDRGLRIAGKTDRGEGETRRWGESKIGSRMAKQTTDDGPRTTRHRQGDGETRRKMKYENPNR